MADTQNGLVITQGDDSNALNNTITIELDTDLDLTGYTAAFQISNIRWTFDDITDKLLTFVITREQSLQLTDGVEYGALKIFDNENRAITVLRDVPIYVKTQVVDNE